MKTILITIACTVLATTLIFAAITTAYVVSRPKVYRCEKVEPIKEAPWAN